jgi:hypothetical protein
MEQNKFYLTLSKQFEQARNAANDALSIFINACGGVERTQLVRAMALRASLSKCVCVVACPPMADYVFVHASFDTLSRSRALMLADCSSLHRTPTAVSMR